MKIALVYDRVNKWGGAERVLLALHELFPEAPLYTTVYSKKNASWAEVFPEVIPSFLNKIPFISNHHELLGLFTPIAFETFDFTGYDFVISITSEAAKGIIVKPPTKHICYCLTPTRYLWSGYKTYFKNFFFRKISSLSVKYLRKWDYVAAQRPDKIIAISTEVQKRIKKYYNRDSEIIYPPVDTKKPKNSKIVYPAEPRLNRGRSREKSKNYYLQPKTYFLIVSRLVPYKRVDLAIEAFLKLELPLVIVGTGSEEKKYKSKYKSKRNIRFLGFVSEQKLENIYQKAKAFIMPQEEDFGIATVEAQGKGIPVIAYNKGGAVDIVSDGITGVLFDMQTVDALVSAVNSFEKMKFDPSVLIDNARRFEKKRFHKDFLDFVRRNI